MKGLKPLVLVDNISVVYHGSESPALEKASLIIDSPGLVVLTGPNGGGKTTLLRLLSGILVAFYNARVDGRVIVAGRDPVREPEKLIGTIALLGQDPKTQVIGPTVYLEAGLYYALTGVDAGVAHERIIDTLRGLGLLALAERHVTTLSSGELEKTAFAGVLSLDPSVMLLDEPTSYLDEEAVGLVIDIIRDLVARGILVVAATHNGMLVEEADEAYIVDGSVREGVYRGPGPPRVSNINKLNNIRDQVLLLEDLTITYPGRPSPILHVKHLHARKGEMITLWGPNGSGKTSLLHAIAGRGVAFQGSRRVFEKPVLVPADPLLLFPRGRLGDAIRDTSLIPVWARKLLDKPLLTMSGGELRLASLALALASGRRLFLVDEPTIGLDPWNRVRVLEALREMADAGYTVVAAGHDPWLRRVSDRVYCVDGGRVWEC